jgi:hypothetical protein
VNGRVLRAVSCVKTDSKLGHISINSHGDSGVSQVDALLQTSSRPSEYLKAADCPLCDWSSILRKRNTTSQGQDLVVPSRRFMKHLGRHLEEIALFVIPQPDDDDDEGGSEDVGSNAVHVTNMDEGGSLSTLTNFRSEAVADNEVEGDNNFTIEHELTIPRPTRPTYSEEQKFFVVYHRVLEELSWPEIEDKFATFFNLRTKPGLASLYYRTRREYGMEDPLKAGPGDPRGDRGRVEMKAAHLSREFLTNVGYFN